MYVSTSGTLILNSLRYDILSLMPSEMSITSKDISDGIKDTKDFKDFKLDVPDVDTFMAKTLSHLMDAGDLPSIFEVMEEQKGAADAAGPPVALVCENSRLVRETRRTG